VADKKDDKKKLNARLNAIKGYLENKEQKVKQDANNLGDNFFDSANSVSHKLGSITSDSVKKLPKSNIFEELVELLSGAITNHKVNFSNHPKKTFLKGAALQAVQLIGRKLNDHVRQEFLRGLNVSTQLGCGVDASIGVSQIRIKPSEFDLFEMLKIDPTSATGRALYETDDFTVNPGSLNRMFYNAFNGITQDVFSINNNLLFSITWQQATQEYLITNIMNRNVYNLIVEYFLTVNLFDQKNLYALVTALMTGSISSDRNVAFTNNLNTTNRLISRIFSYCQDKQQNAADSIRSDNTKEFEDLPYEVSDLFDFDDVEGLFLEEETLRANQVLKFSDCGNLEVPVDTKRNEEFLDDFNRNLDNANDVQHIDNFLNDTAYNSFQTAGGTIPLELLRINVSKNFIKILPKAMAHLLLTPKVIFPFVLIRRVFGATVQQGVKMLKSIFKIVFNIIRKLFEEFITEFFRLVKKEIVNIISAIVQDALKELAVKRTTIIRQLVSVFKSLSAVGGDVSSCGNMISTILGLMSTTTNLPFSIPTPLLLAATRRSGFSNVRAFINVVEELDKAGIPTGDLYGQPNKHVIQHLAHIRGVERERDENSVINATIVTGTVATPAGPGTFIPGTVKIVGISG
jgi:hypothetical protein